MEVLQWAARPELRDPVIVTAFAGWNDAGDAATGAVNWLADAWEAEDFASIDAEEFFDFTATRPTVRMVDGVNRSIEWPGNIFSAARTPNGRDVVFLLGVEPQLRWKTFCSAIGTLANEIGAKQIITLGALLADVPHTRPAPVTANGSSANALERLGLSRSQYEGPTGIVGVLQHIIAGEPTLTHVECVSLWAAVPHYVSQNSSPKALLALIENTVTLLDAPVNTSELAVASSNYEEQISQLISDDEDLVTYVRELEQSEDMSNPGESIAAEAERFLRGSD